MCGNEQVCERGNSGIQEKKEERDSTLQRREEGKEGRKQRRMKGEKVMSGKRKRGKDFGEEGKEKLGGSDSWFIQGVGESGYRN